VDHHAPAFRPTNRNIATSGTLIKIDPTEITGPKPGNNTVTTFGVTRRRAINASHEIVSTIAATEDQHPINGAENPLLDEVRKCSDVAKYIMKSSRCSSSVISIELVFSALTRICDQKDLYHPSLLW